MKIKGIITFLCKIVKTEHLEVLKINNYETCILN